MSDDKRKPSLLDLVINGGVLALLAGIWILGHHTGWTIAPLRTRTGGSQSASSPAWCGEHGAPEETCVVCHPELGGADPADWCGEHGVPESLCTLCSPSRIAKFGTDVPGRPGCVTHLKKVQLASPEAREKLGIQLAGASRGRVIESAAAPGELIYDRTRTVRVSSRAAGSVRRVLVEQGSHVEAAGLLALLEIPEAGRARSDLIRALAELDLRRRSLSRIRESASEGYRTRQELDEASSALEAARAAALTAQQTLATLGIPLALEDLDGLPARDARDRIARAGLPAEMYASWSSDPAILSLTVLRTPLAGKVLERSAVEGSVVDPEDELFVLADPTALWIELDLRSEDAARITSGMVVAFRSDLAQPEVRGRIAWVSGEQDQRSRTVQARAIVDAPPAGVRTNTFGMASIRIRDQPDALMVPDAAVAWEGCCKVVFVPEREDLFAVRKVRTGVSTGGYSEIYQGLTDTDRVVVRGTALLVAQLLRYKLGAGCADD